MNTHAHDADLDLAELHQACRDYLDPELRNYRFLPSEGSIDEHAATHVYRGGDRFIELRIEGGQPAYGAVALGVGAEDAPITKMNTLTLEQLIDLNLGGSGRGRYPLDQMSVREFLEHALHDMVEYAHEFLYGDIRGFIRMLAMSHREKHSKEESAQRPHG